MDLKKINLFGKDISKTVSRTCKVATEKSSQLIEEAKLRLQIANANDTISEKLEEIGALVYEDYKSGNPSYTDFEDLCKEVEEQEVMISNMKSTILKAKKLKQCEVCENPLALDDKYCSKCGAEQPEIIEEKDIEEVDVEPLTECPNCATKLKKDDAFCSKCGVKLN